MRAIGTILRIAAGAVIFACMIYVILAMPAAVWDSDNDEPTQAAQESRR